MTVIIAGGGIAGIASALALAGRGVSSVVCEQAEDFAEIGAGLQLGPNAMRALGRLGAREALEPSLVAPRAIEIRDGLNGGILSHIPLDSGFKERFGEAYHVVHRGDLLAALVEVASAQPRITLERGHRLTGFDQEDGTVRAIFAGGQALSGRALVGADGIRSTVRQLLLCDGPPGYSGQVIYRTLMPADRAPDIATEPIVRLWLCAGGHVVHYPVSGGSKVNIVAAFDSDWSHEGWSALGFHAELLSAFRRACDVVCDILEAPERWLKWAGADRPPVPDWSRGRIGLVGDAAHPVLPYLAQGAAMALEDAVVLGTSLDASAGDPERAFVLFTRERLQRTARMRRECRMLAWAYHASGPTRVARNTAIRLMGVRRAIDRMAWIYDWGSGKLNGPHQSRSQP